MKYFNKIGFLGFGNMGQALATGLVNHHVFAPEQIYPCAQNQEKLQANAAKLGLQPCSSIDELLNMVDTVIIAIKPHLIPAVLGPKAKELASKLIISLAANFPYQQYKELLPNSKILCTIPNTPVAVGQGIIICEAQHDLTAEEVEQFQKYFGQIALVEFLPTAQIPVAGVVAGCGPAFAAMFIEALGDAGVMEGLSRTTAYALASKMIQGTASLQLQSNLHPGFMKDQVCSPKGTTIQGVRTLEAKGFRSSIIEAVAHICHKK